MHTYEMLRRLSDDHRRRLRDEAACEQLARRIAERRPSMGRLHLELRGRELTNRHSAPSGA